MTTASEAFQRELVMMRQRHRGDIFRGTASFACETPRCAVGIVRIGCVEERGAESLPFQWPLFWSRCRQPFERYVSLDLGR